MNRSIKILLFFLFSIICSCGNSVFEIGSTIPSDAINMDKELIMTSPSSINSAYSITKNGIKYDIGADDKNRICFISTSDPKFLTEDGVSVDDTYDKSRKIIKKDAYKMPGWAYVLDLKDGWHAAFFVGEKATNEELKPGSKVVFLYKD